MTTTEATQKKRVFIASSPAEFAEVRAAFELFDVELVTVEHSATPGTSWVQSLQRCIHGVDLVIGIIADRWKSTQAWFEMGVASALGKPTFLFLAPGLPIDLIPPSGIPYLRIDFSNEQSVRFGIQQVLSLSWNEDARQFNEGFTTHPIGMVADEILAKLTDASGRELELLIYEAVKASGAVHIAVAPEADDRGIDIAVWSNDLEPTIANPLLIECKTSLRSQADVNEAIGRMYRALSPIQNGCGLVIYKEAREVPTIASGAYPIVFISAEEFIHGLRSTGLAEFVRKLRNVAVHVA